MMKRRVGGGRGRRNSVDDDFSSLVEMKGRKGREMKKREWRGRKGKGREMKGRR